MQLLSLTLDSPAENLALDEALLDAAENGELAGEVLRLWEMPSECAVLGRSSDAGVEVNLDACRQASVPVLRRASGGGTILAGPGCLMYSLVLDLTTRPHLRAIDQAHQFIMQCMSELLSPLEAEVRGVGTSDLALRRSADTPWLKFSGNAMRIKRDHLLYHGTLLYAFDLNRIEQLLATPTRTPSYREERGHKAFVTNLAVERSQLVACLTQGWQADEPLRAWPMNQTAVIAESKYHGDPKWTIFDPTR